MAKFSTERIRNIVLLSHSGAGKTILAEAMLHTSGATTRLGRVEDGTTTSDFDPEEHKRGYQCKYRYPERAVARSQDQRTRHPRIRRLSRRGSFRYPSG